MPEFYINRGTLEAMSRNGSESERISVPYRIRVCKGMLPECLLQNVTACISLKNPNYLLWDKSPWNK